MCVRVYISVCVCCVFVFVYILRSKCCLVVVVLCWLARCCDTLGQKYFSNCWDSGCHGDRGGGGGDSDDAECDACQYGDLVSVTAVTWL
jgi:hypothetical protein